MKYPVKYFHSTMVGAPSIAGVAGNNIAALDALLIDGFNLKSVQGVSVTNNEATVTFASAHGFEAEQIIFIDGSSTAEINGEHRVTWADATSLKFIDISGVADGAVSGTMTCKVAPVGDWEKVFSGTNKAVYRSADPASSRRYLRVDDADPMYSKVVGYESMTDIDTGTGMFPTAEQLSTGYAWRKSNQASTTARPWKFAGDSMFFYLFIRWHSTTSYTNATNRFGDILSYKQGDAYHALIGGNKPTDIYPGHDSFYALNITNDAYMARSYAQIGTAIATSKIGVSTQVGMGSAGEPYPSPVDNGLHLHRPVFVLDGTSNTSPIRGEMPGLFQPLNDRPLNDGVIVDNITGAPGRRIVIISLDQGSGQNYARAAIDITGPWR